MRKVTFSCILAAALAHGDELRDHTLLATAQPAVAHIAPLADGKEFVTLPTLEFTLQLQPRCPRVSDLAFVSVSVADSYLALDSTELGGEGPVRTALDLPTQQGAPVRVVGFCHNGRDDVVPELLIPGAFTARVSLRCSATDSSTLSYETLPLDVLLTCDRDDQAP